jgi:hypothetical protein
MVSFVAAEPCVIGIRSNISSNLDANSLVHSTSSLTKYCLYFVCNVNAA